MGMGERTRVVVRHLPANLPEQVFWDAVKTYGADEATAREFVQGKVRSRRDNKADTASRAYLHFADVDHVLAFSQAFEGHAFRNDKGVVTHAKVEFSPYQKAVSAQQASDHRQGTIEDDDDYKAFLQALESVSTVEPAAGPSSEASVPTTTPIIEFLRAQRKASSSTKQAKRAATQAAKAKGVKPEAAKAAKAKATPKPAKQEAAPAKPGKKAARRDQPAPPPSTEPKPGEAPQPPTSSRRRGGAKAQSNKPVRQVAAEASTSAGEQAGPATTDASGPSAPTTSSPKPKKDGAQRGGRPPRGRGSTDDSAGARRRLGHALAGAGLGRGQARGGKRGQEARPPAS